MKIILFDGHNMLFKFFFGMPPFIKSKHGDLIHGALGFVACILRQTKDIVPIYPIVCFDSQKQSSKEEEFSFYKANRIKNFDSNPLTNPFSQLKFILQSLDYLEIPWIMEDGFEADEVIGTLAKKFSEEGNEVVIFSEDTDFFQLVTEKISICKESKKIKVIYSTQIIEDKLGIQISQIVDYKSIIGDKADNIKGIYGIGPKTAVKLLNNYKDLDGIFNNLSNLKITLQNKFVQAKELLYINKQLVKINTVTIKKVPALKEVGFTTDISTKKVFQAIDIW